MLQSPNSMVILAGGLGKRIQHIANGQPKILLPILGNPFIEYQLQWFQSQGIQDVLLILSFGADQVVNYLKARPPTPGLKVYGSLNQSLKEPAEHFSLHSSKMHCPLSFS